MDVECVYRENGAYHLVVHRKGVKYQKIMLQGMFRSTHLQFHQIPKIIRCQKINERVSSFYTVTYEPSSDKIIIKIILVCTKSLVESKDLETIVIYLTKISEYEELLQQVIEMKIEMDRIEKAQTESRQILLDAKKMMKNLREYARQKNRKTKKNARKIKNVQDQVKRQFFTSIKNING